MEFHELDIEKINKNPVNILYLTTDCNFKCSYCYENQKKLFKKYYATNEEIKNFVDNIVLQSEPSIKDYTVCLMGGEPLLASDQLDFFMEYIKKYPEKYFSLNIITNGSLVHLYIDRFKKWIKQKNAFFGLDISYDGSFQYQRTTSDIVEKNMDLLYKEGILFGISYTITKPSLKDNTYLKDFIHLINKYYSNVSDRCRQRFRINIDTASFEYNKNISNNTLFETKENFIKKLTEQCLYLYSKYKISFCNFSCEYCKKCNFSNTGRRYTVPKSGIIIEPMTTYNKFNHF